MKFAKNLSFMFKFIWRHNKAWLLLTAVSTIMGAIVPIIGFIIPKYIVDSVFEKNSLLLGIKWTVLLVVIQLVVGCITSLIGYQAAKQKNKLFCAFNIYMAELIMDMDYKELENPDTLDMKEKAMRSAFSGGRGFCGSVEVFFGIIQSVIVFVGATFKVTELNPLLIFVIFIIIILNTFFNNKVMNDNYKLDQMKTPIERKNNYEFGVINDFSIGKEVRIYDLKDFIIGKYKATATESNGFYNKAFLNNTKNTIFSMTTANIQLIVVYIVLLMEVVTSSLTYGDFVAQFSAVNTLSSSLLSVVNSVLAINHMGFYIDDLTEFIKLPRMLSVDGRSLPQETPIVFKFINVSFKYPGSESYALKNVNLSFSCNDKLSFVGLNGAGKTTFIKLLLRLYDVTSGEITLNGINIKEFNFREYMKLFSAVFQDYKLFAYNVKENITLSEHSCDERLLSHVVHESGVEEFIEDKPNGISSYVYKLFDESGFEPSGGEGQKIAIARALYKNAKFVILDEPTSALDPLAEYNLYEKINNLTKNKGCLFISHRLSSTITADKICVFDDGGIVETGTHKELMSISHGLYKEMFEKQASYYNAEGKYENSNN